MPSTQSSLTLEARTCPEFTTDAFEIEPWPSTLTPQNSLGPLYLEPPLLSTEPPAKEEQLPAKEEQLQVVEVKEEVKERRRKKGKAGRAAKIWCHFYLEPLMLQEHFDVNKKIIGHGGANTRRIFEETGETS